MNVTCNKCGKKYVIADDKVAGKASVKIRCKQCQNLIAVAVSGGGVGTLSSSPSGVSSPSGLASAAGAPPPPRDWEDEPTRAAPAPDFNVAWFAMIGGKQQGPFDIGSLQSRVTAGEVTLRTYLWRPGMPDWKRASEVPEVSLVFAGVSVGAAATGLTQAAPVTKRPSSTRTPAVQRDVATANEVPSLEVAAKQTAPATTAADAARLLSAVGQEPAPSAVVARAVSPSAEAPGPQEGWGLNAPLGAASASEKAQTGAEAQLFPGGLATQPPDEDGAPADPFSQLAPANSGDPAAIGEATRFFIAKAGVHKRNPPWKIALFVLGAVGLVVGLGSILQALNIVPKVTRTTDDGREVQESFFSPGGMSGIKDLLTGEAQRKRQQAEAERQRQRQLGLARTVGTERAPEPVAEDAVPPSPKTKDPALASLYQENDLPTRGPKMRKTEESAGPQVNAAGLSQEAAMKVVSDKSKAFQQCVDAALHRNPNLAVGNVTIVLVVGPSGAVKSASVEPKKHEGSDWAQCMVSAGKRVVFPQSDGETQVEVPFKVGVALVP